MTRAKEDLRLDLTLQRSKTTADFPGPDCRQASALHPVAAKTDSAPWANYLALRDRTIEGTGDSLICYFLERKDVTL